MDDVALSNYVAGCFDGPVEAGRLDRLCADLIGVDPGTPIWFSRYTLEKLRYIHGDINFSHYSHMPSILLQGFIARGRKPHVLELWWVTAIGTKRVAFAVVLKATKNKEVFIQTFHRIDVAEARRRLNGAHSKRRLVREQANTAALLKGGTDHISKKKKGA
jgi:hypothetical protein